VITFRSTPLRFLVIAISLLSVSIVFYSKAQDVGVPVGFSKIFDGKDLKGWHLSRTNHHGTTGNVTVEDGAIVLRQRPFGQGGLLLTDKKYKNFDLYLESRPDYGCNGGIFFRSTESGSAYQIELVGGAARGDLIGENMRVSKSYYVPADDIKKVWKDDDWNSFRLRVVGDVPEITLWINGVQMYDVQEPVNDKIAGETDGYIGLQLHWNSLYETTPGGRDMVGTWKPDSAHRFRNIAIKELP
jgi:hypothetical protein